MLNVFSNFFSDYYNISSLCLCLKRQYFYGREIRMCKWPVRRHSSVLVFNRYCWKRNVSVLNSFTIIQSFRFWFAMEVGEALFIFFENCVFIILRLYGFERYFCFFFSVFNYLSIGWCIIPRNAAWTYQWYRC